MTRRSLAAIAGAAALVLTGCGSVQPGVAARVGDEVIPVDEVDRFAEALCEVSAAGGGGAVPTRQFRVTAAQVLIGNTLAEQYREAEGGAVDQSQVQQQMQQNEASLPEVPEAEREVFLSTLRDFVSGQLYLIEQGRQDLVAEGAANVDQQTAQQRGNELLAAWAEEVEVEVDPRFGSYEDGALVAGTGSLSVPVSDSATAADAPTPAPDLVGSLPESQTCG